VPDIIGNAVVVPISPQGVAHRRVGADPANKLVIFAVSITSLAISFSFYGRLRMSNAPASAIVVSYAKDRRTFGPMIEAINGLNADLTADSRPARTSFSRISRMRCSPIARASALVWTE
jgi:hypothetical protein